MFVFIYEINSLLAESKLLPSFRSTAIIKFDDELSGILMYKHLAMQKHVIIIITQLSQAKTYQIFSHK